jgi:spore coat polysaccharide biosynthesis predicted glycosyltransferase SpsG
MRAVFRVDAGGAIGLGNAYRALSVAHALAEAALCSPDEVTFWLGYSAAAASLIESAGFGVRLIGTFTHPADEYATHARLLLEDQPELVLVDVPEVPDRAADFYHSLRGAATRLLVNLSDQNSGRCAADVIVQGDVYHLSHDGERCARPRTLSGARCTLLNPSFARLAEQPAPQRTHDLLICFGGSDPAHMSARIVAMLETIHMRLSITLIIGRDAPHVDVPSGWAVYRDLPPSRIAELMRTHRIGILSGGLMQYEAACLGLPCLIIAQNAGQFPASQAFDAAGVHRFLGSPETLSGDALIAALDDWLSDPTRLTARASLAQHLVDGRGCSRLVDVIREEFSCHNA